MISPYVTDGLPPLPPSPKSADETEPPKPEVTFDIGGHLFSYDPEILRLERNESLIQEVGRNTLPQGQAFFLEEDSHLFERYVHPYILTGKKPDWKQLSTNQSQLKKVLALLRNLDLRLLSEDYAAEVEQGKVCATNPTFELGGKTFEYTTEVLNHPFNVSLLSRAAKNKEVTLPHPTKDAYLPVFETFLDPVIRAGKTIDWEAVQQHKTSYQMLLHLIRDLEFSVHLKSYRLAVLDGKIEAARPLATRLDDPEVEVVLSMWMDLKVSPWLTIAQLRQDFAKRIDRPVEEVWLGKYGRSFPDTLCIADVLPEVPNGINVILR